MAAECVSHEGKSVQEVTEWVLQLRESDHAMCRGLYIFNSEVKITPWRDWQLAQEVREWVLHPCESDHAECGGAFIFANPITLSAEEFISLTSNIGAKNRNRIPQKIFKIESRGKTIIVTSLL